MGENAIYDDALETEQPEPTPEQNQSNSDRADIAQMARDLRDKESEEVEQEELEEEKEVETLDTKIEEEPEKVTLKIDGKEVEVESSKIFDTGKRALQKELSADKRLAEATQIKQEAEALLEQAKTPDEPNELGDKLESITDRIQFGTKEEGQAALQDLVTEIRGQETTTADPVQIAHQVQDKLAYDAATEYMEKEYDDVMSDSKLKNIFSQRENELRDEGDTRSYKDLYIAIAEEVREWKSGLSKPITDDGLQDRQNRKKEITTLKSGTAPAGGNEPKAPKTQKTIIAEMRKSRGQS